MDKDEFRHLRDIFVARHFGGGTLAVQSLDSEESQLAVHRSIKEGRGFTEVDASLRKHGVVPMLARARAYTPFSRKTCRPHVVSVIPYNAAIPESDLVGSIGISDGEPASGILVQLKNYQIVLIRTLDFIKGQLVEVVINANELIAKGPAAFVEKNWPRRPSKRFVDAFSVEHEEGADLFEPNFPASMPRRIALEVYRTLLFDEYSAMVYSADEVRDLAFNAPTIATIAELQYMRHLGVPTADSCCCCCSCCWGSCSCCSATSHDPTAGHAFHWL